MSTQRIEKQLSEKNQKILKYEKRIAYIFSAILLSLGALLNLCLILTKAIDLNLLLLINLGIIIICFSIIFLMNRKYNLDLKEEEKLIKVQQVQSKKIETSHEAGSGAMYIPILGDLFPKLWGQKMRASQIYYLNIDNYRNEVDKEIYDTVNAGDFVEMHYARNSNILLEIRAL